MFDFVSRKISSIFSWLGGSGRVGKQEIEKVFAQLEEALLEADVPFETVDSFIADLRTKIDLDELAKHANPGNMLMKQVHQQLMALLAGTGDATSAPTFAIPSSFLFLGLQGAGKTTTLAKVARYLQMQAQKRGKKRRIVCASVDYYRPAAREQLQILAEQLGIDYFAATSDDPVEAARECVKYQKEKGYEHLLLDTAGRMHVSSDMMDELQAVCRVVSPRYKVLVLDSMTGQESLSVAQSFAGAVGFDAAVMSKCDSDARGGSSLAFRAVLKKPIWFVGIGEKIDDLEAFVPERMVSRLIGMGDLATLLEKADEKVDQVEQERVANRMLGGAFSLQDFLEQIEMVNKMGALQMLSRYLPGVAQMSPDEVSKSESGLKTFRAIIQSMTPKERFMPAILNGDRRKRIAAGAGVTVQDVNQLMEKFEQSKQFVKMIKKSGRFGR
jgi:signal recognition particle subunit SRP54